MLISVFLLKSGSDKADENEDDADMKKMRANLSGNLYKSFSSFS